MMATTGTTGTTGSTVQVVTRGKNAAIEEIRVLGARRFLSGEFYHAFLRARWSAVIAGIVVFYLLLNAVFAALYVITGGIANARSRSFLDAYYFSVQTMGTIGYGAMYPQGGAANALVILESVTSLIVTAVVTGLVFSKFSLLTAKVAFAHKAVIGPFDGVPTLMIRFGNERKSQIIEAHIRVMLMRTELTKEGTTFYRMHDLALTRALAPALTRSWTVMHPIVPGSPLHGASPDTVKRDEVELVVTINGTDETSLQPVHARARYMDDAIIWGARFADVLSQAEDGVYELNLHKFNDITPTAPMPEFPYPEGVQELPP
jgi:inward rectifier potassium channel